MGRSASNYGRFLTAPAPWLGLRVVCIVAFVALSACGGGGADRPAGARSSRPAAQAQTDQTGTTAPAGQVANSDADADARGGDSAPNRDTANARIVLDRSTNPSPGTGSADSATATDAVTVTGSATGTTISPDLLAQRGARVLPEDYQIGPLQDLIDAPRPERAVVRNLSQFFTELADAAFAAELVSADQRRSLERSLQPHLREGRVPVALRIGTVAVTDEVARANIRLFARAGPGVDQRRRGRAEGEAYLVATREGWLLSDLQIDLQQLDQPYTEPAEPYTPRSYRWLLVD